MVHSDFCQYEPFFSPQIYQIFFYWLSCKFLSLDKSWLFSNPVRGYTVTLSHPIICWPYSVILILAKQQFQHEASSIVLEYYSSIRISYILGTSTKDLTMQCFYKITIITTSCPIFHKWFELYYDFFIQTVFTCLYYYI